FNRPKMHVFNLELMEAILTALRDAEADAAVRAIVLRGAGSVFSAGLDFKAMMQARMEGPEQGERFGETMRQGFRNVWTCPKPTVAAVTGHAIAAGFFVAAACDFRYVAEGPGRYGMNELVFGAPFPPIAVEIGRYALQREMAHAIQSAELYGWEEGLRNGTFHKSFPTEEAVVKAAVEQAAKVGAMPREAYAQVKSQLLAPYVARVDNESEEHKRMTAAIYDSAETLEATMRYVANIVGQKG
ncbi:MAG: enoyl-CoA hydratase/isomerase family protein, partial [Candidatus Methylomirabilis sp.]|nr:enoyl-CoA hydratase/isomerase family protein [Deltaproteobacteria bacterium]